ncbi:anhydro-N-acetylmuramic acid kinase [Calothrix sp. UHCC 0171]|uniref:anhydro-N-acetylmuramic acid kinase n=1 Tax=Calothrix sp. UHCC 0171 TaxID=3110245 RepID=UPI002B205AB4|nr:anhydro-N-acetylmuramic acid kinase [Calothrix sp. UHCC 0171]MEA5571710.1 anhydro-N-acetylmuramic acid kinase [Calothrix sp. UHCC 0171]
MVRVIGLMSGTSVDGIDAALVEISGKDLDIQIELIAAQTYPYPPKLREKILWVCAGEAISMQEFAELDDAIACSFADAAQCIQNNKAASHEKAILIGSHGQTVYHRPPVPLKYRDIKSSTSPSSSLGYSLQLGRGELIAHLTNTTTISNFRSADIATGGQGAPLVPRIDAALLSHPQENRCVQNIGGISNVAYLPARQGDWLEKIRGWDTGPGNSLLDLAVYQLSNGAKTYDENGDWAASGNICQTLVEEWLQHEYFHTPPPKSTGRELFGVDYLKQCFADAAKYQLSPADFLATLTELTAASIVENYRLFLPQLPQRVLLCGGGSRNLYLQNRLRSRLGEVPVTTTDEFGLNADFKEAIAFAVLAYWRQMENPGNLPSATGANQEVLLGDIHQFRAM